MEAMNINNIPINCAKNQRGAEDLKDSFLLKYQKARVNWVHYSKDDTINFKHFNTVKNMKEDAL